MPRPSRLDLDQQLTELGALTDTWLRAAVARHASAAGQPLVDRLEYHLGWRTPDLQPLSPPAPSGKKLRPALVLLVAQALRGEITPAAQQAAAAVELIHNFSLVHDDIQDHSALRRHRPTVWSLWGMPQGINVGDALFALAQIVLSEPGPAQAAQMSYELNRTAFSLAEGQFLDIELQEGRTAPTVETYEAMVTRKTGLLFACACRLGALAAEASEASCQAFSDYGLELGIAFQEQDDLLGVWGRSTETGKPDAADIVERKRGLPAVIALSQPSVPEWLRSIYDDDNAEDGADSGNAEARPNICPQTIERVISHFDDLGVQATIEHRVEARYRAALEHLQAAGARPPARDYLEAICEALVSRRT
ncbi:MAG: polyprenyl synthetase family protein [Chloroflexi bacterium]|nr:polyprenyl synthetase family protein [Chloroflexota bacterium]